MSPKAVGVVIVASVLFYVAFDAYLYLDDIDGNSFSQVITSWALSSPLAAGSIGAFLVGLFVHFLDVKKQKKRKGERK